MIVDNVMVKFNSTKKAIKPKKVKNRVVQTVATKPNKAATVYERSFLTGRYIWSLAFIVLGLSALIVRAVYVQIVNVETLTDEADKRSLRKQEIQSVRQLQLYLQEL